MVVNAEREFEASISVEEIQNGMLVREIMSKNVFVIDAKASVLEVAREMMKRNVGSMIITDDGDSVGIITERDIIFKAVVNNVLPGNMTCGDIMSSPIISVRPSMGVIEATELMVRSKIRRLPVMENSYIVGVLTDRDIMTVAPGLNTILESLIELHYADNLTEEKEIERGVCQRCGKLRESLIYLNGSMMCEDCREEEGYYD
ncbi:CBS domain-containing protein [Methanolobus sp. ZRKC3]|uniref:CBS domain-containing protein n=1 Tax=Methanolobus sp. ZRKC3 TaxID=3125786 RepID=UPI0032516ED8